MAVIGPMMFGGKFSIYSNGAEVLKNLEIVGWRVEDRISSYDHPLYTFTASCGHDSVHYFNVLVREGVVRSDGVSIINYEGLEYPVYIDSYEMIQHNAEVTSMSGHHGYIPGSMEVIICGHIDSRDIGEVDTIIEKKKEVAIKDRFEILDL